MNQHKQSSDLHIGRGWLNRAAEMLDACEDHVSDAEFARAAAAIGNGFIALAYAERAAVSMAETSQVRQAILSLSDEPTLAAAEREQRAEAEARPHDDEPKHAVDDGVVWVVADVDGPIHGTLSQTSAQAWASDNEGDHEGLSVTALAVDRG